MIESLYLLTFFFFFLLFLIAIKIKCPLFVIWQFFDGWIIKNKIKHNSDIKSCFFYMFSFRRLFNINKFKLSCWITRKYKILKGTVLQDKVTSSLRYTLRPLMHVFWQKQNFHYLRVGDKPSLRFYGVYVHLCMGYWSWSAKKLFEV